MGQVDCILAAYKADVRVALNRVRSHLFDGVSVFRNVGNYQLCDISDPLLRQLLDDPKWFADECNVRSSVFSPASSHC